MQWVSLTLGPTSPMSAANIMLRLRHRRGTAIHHFTTFCLSIRKKILFAKINETHRCA
jgi:hypothetical protein